MNLSIGDQAQIFAEALSPLACSLDSSCRGFTTGRDDATGFYLVAPQDINGMPNINEPIKLRVDGITRAYLRVHFYCTSSSLHHFLTVNSSKFSLSLLQGEPLIRLEYERSLQSPFLPPSHYHVHAHRDAWAFLASFTGTGKGTRRKIKNSNSRTETPTIAQTHLPTGGQYFRPCLEDFILFIINEFGVEHSKETLNLIYEGRERWLEKQVRAMTLRKADIVIDELRNQGFIIESPQ